MLATAKLLDIGLAITDHNQVAGSLEALQQSEVFIIPGVELTVGPGIHLLCYFATGEQLQTFADKVIEEHRGVNPFILTLSVEKCLRLAKEHGATMVVPHSYKLTQGGLIRYIRDAEHEAELMKSFDAIEGLNGVIQLEKNDAAVGWATRVQKPLTGGSDGHETRELDRVVTLAKARTPAEFLNAIRTGQTDIVGREFTGTYKRRLRLRKEIKLLSRPGGWRILRDQIKYNVFRKP